MESFGQLLKGFRTQKGFTQKRLAQQAEVDHTYISRMESEAIVTPSRHVALSIANALKLNKEEKKRLLAPLGYIGDWAADQLAELQMEFPEISMFTKVLQSDSLSEEQRENIRLALQNQLKDYLRFLGLEKEVLG